MKVFVALGLAISFLAGGMLITATTSEPNEKGVQEMQQELQLAKQKQEELEQEQKAKQRVVNPTKIQKLYLSIELGSKFDEDLFTGLEFLGEKGTRYSHNNGYLIYAFGTEDEYITVYIDTNNDDKIYRLYYNNNQGTCHIDDIDNDYPALLGECSIDWHYFDSKEEQINYLKGVIPY